MYPSPGYCGEIIHLYGAAGLHFGQQHLDEGEYLDVVRMPLDEAVRRVMTGEIKDAKTAIAILKLKERIIHDLFRQRSHHPTPAPACVAAGEQHAHRPLCQSLQPARSGD